MTGNNPYTALFLCTGNSARSILGEAILNHLGEGRFLACSAGSQPTGKVNHYAIELLESLDYPLEGLRSKSWHEFTGPNAPAIDFIFTVCDNAAQESCPIWPGHPMTVHWGIPDPAAVEGTDADKRQAFADAYDTLSNRIEAFIGLLITSPDKIELHHQLRKIGQTLPDSA